MAITGVGRVLYTSHQRAALNSPFGPARDHAATEQALDDSGLAWTSLRSGFYAHSLDWLAGPWRKTGVITVPADGPVSWTAREDEAEAAAVIIASGGGYDRPTNLTAGEALTFQDIAVIASELIDRPNSCDVVDPDAWTAAQITAGRPEFVARFALGTYQAANQGYFAGTDPLLAALFQREPRAVRDALSKPPTDTAS